MEIFKKIIFLVAIAIIAAANIIIFLNSHFYHRGEKAEEAEEKIESLESAAQFFPFNDLVYYEVGKAYLELGTQRFIETEERSAYLEKSIQNFRRAIRINPASPFNHFYLAETQLYLRFFSPPLDESCYDELKKAAILAGENSLIFYEVGKTFLSRWFQISDEDRDFTARILGKVMLRKNWEQVRFLLRIWEMSINDTEVMRRILPEDPDIYLIYADFLGEKSLFLEERQRFLAEAEYMEFEKAKSEHESGEDKLLYYEVREASDQFRSVIKALEKIKFFQNLTQQNLIDQADYKNLQKSAFLNLAICALEEGKELKEIEADLRKYIALEEKVAGANELASYLSDRGLISKKLEESFTDLDQLSFELSLYFKQNRYMDIVRVGRLLQESFFTVPRGKREEYVRILQLLGDASQKIDYIYDAGEFYRQALEIEPENLETLWRLRQNYERLNADRKVREIQAKIEKLMSSKKKLFDNLTINIGGSLRQTLILDGRKIALNLRVQDLQEEIAPLLTVFFNGRVVWEDYLEDNILSVALESRVGKNSLKIVPVNRAISPVKLSYR